MSLPWDLLGWCHIHSGLSCRCPCSVWWANQVLVFQRQILRTGCRSFGMRPNSILRTCPSQRMHHWVRMTHVLGMPVWDKKLAFVTWSCQVTPQSLLSGYASQRPSPSLLVRVQGSGLTHRELRVLNSLGTPSFWYWVSAWCCLTTSLLN